MFAAPTTAYPALFAFALATQGSPPASPAPHIVVPEWRVVPPNGNLSTATLQMDAVMARVNIDGALATTDLRVSLVNHGSAAAESVLVVPVPKGAVVRSFSYDVVVDEPGIPNAPPKPSVQSSARVMPDGEARALYESIVRQSRDPGLLEFAGHQSVRSNVFPIPARGHVKSRIVYEQLLEKDGDRFEYMLPRSEALDGARVPWTIVATVRAEGGVRGIYSPSHRLNLSKLSEEASFVEIDSLDKTAAGAFQLSYLTGGGDVASSFIVDAEAGSDSGYFLWVAGFPDHVKNSSAGPVPRELTVVLDRSASMGGTKMRQAQDAALRLLEGLKPGESFNIIDYADQVTKLYEAPTVKTDVTMGDAKSYIEHTTPGGGTNLHGGLAEALRQPLTPGTYPLVVFLTDGLPTVGTTVERDIREDAVKLNTARRRVYTFGVGNDVNAPLLDHLADASRGTSTYVQPNESIDSKVSQVLKRLTQPFLTQPKLEPLDAAGRVSWARVRDVMPAAMSDLLANESIVVLGRFHGDDPITFRLSGEDRGGVARQFTFVLDPRAAKARVESSANAYVSRLWASRRIGELVDGVRMSGAGSSGANAAPSNAQTKESVDEIVSLSTRFGILTEYTSFFANDPVDLAQRDVIHQRVRKILLDRAAAERSGQGAVAQAVNVRRARQQGQLNRENQHLDGNLREVRLANIQQRSDRALFRKGVTWVDSRVFENQTGAPVDAPPDRTVEFGTPEYFDLARRLGTEGRGSVLAVNGQVLLWLDGKRILVKGPA